MPADINPLALLNSALWVGVAYAVSYILLAFGLSLLGARVRQRSTWLAWIPVLNLYLMCRLARAPLLLILPALIPGLNLLVFAFLGARMAGRVGRSQALGALFGLPGLGNVVPLVLGLCRQTAAEQAAPPPAQPPLVTAMIHSGVALTLFALPAAGLIIANRLSRGAESATTVEQATAALPQRIAGTITEFPIDSATTDAAIPSGVSTVTFEQPKPGGKPLAGLPSDQLPPWIKPEAIPVLAESATSAEYFTTGSAARVKVVNLAMREDEAGDPIPPTQQELAALDPEATATGVEVQSPGKVAYRGYRVNTADSVYYALRRADSNSMVLISAKDAASVPVADRLARNVGNGQGLLEDETSRDAIARLPAAPPNCTLIRVNTATSAELNALVVQMNNASNSMQVEDQKAVAIFQPLIRAIIPKSYSMADYASNANSEDGFLCAVAVFSSGSDAWTALQALRTLTNIFAQFGGQLTVTGIDVGAASGYALDAVDTDGSEYSFIVLRHNTALVGFFSEKTSAKNLRPWAESYMAGR